ncbi:MAG: DnaJ domain-containing protein [Pontibacterium sp.]
MHPLGLVLLGTVTIAGMLWIKSKPAKQRRLALLKLSLLLITLSLLYLAITGRLHWLGALVAIGLPFIRKLLPLLLRFFPLLQSVYRQKQSSQQPAANHSEVKTAIIKMTLDHDSGVMYGTVLTGPLKGQELGDLSEQAFMQLLTYCRQEDTDSARLLETYLDKRFGDRWREDDPGEHNGQSKPKSGGSMDRKEAYRILGLKPDADKQAVIDAHRRLMQRVHPDRGGSDYLAAKINQAKEVLLKC